MSFFDIFKNLFKANPNQDNPAFDNSDNWDHSTDEVDDNNDNDDLNDFDSGDTSSD